MLSYGYQPTQEIVENINGLPNLLPINLPQLPLAVANSMRHTLSQPSRHVITNNQNVNPNNSAKTQVDLTIYPPVATFVLRPDMESKKVLGEGTFGCVFTPAFPCEGHNANEYIGLVSKVTNEIEAKKELEISTFLKNIDELESGTIGTLSERYKYGVYALDECHFPVKDPHELYTYFYPGSIKKCSKDINNFQYLTHMESATNNVSYAFQQKSLDGGILVWGENGTANLLSWIHCFENIVKGLRNMNRNNVFHFDLSSNNVLYFGNVLNPITCKLNDFGMTKIINFIHALEYYSFHNGRCAPCLLYPHYYFPPGINVVFYSMVIDEMLKKEKGYDKKWKKNSDQFFMFHRNTFTKKRQTKLNDEIKKSLEFFKKNHRNFLYSLKYFGLEYKRDPNVDYKHFIKNNWRYFNKSFLELCQCVDLYGFATILDNFLKLNDIRKPELIPIIVPFCYDATCLQATYSQALEVIENLKNILV